MTSAIERAVAAVGPERFLDSLTTQEQQALAYQWRLWARPSQLPPPGDWLTWLIMAGRGFGKTRTGAEWIRQRVESGETRRIALVGRTPADARDVMVEGESGILNVFPPDQRPIYEPSKRRITFYTGAMATVYSSENPEQLRGPTHDTAWVDELGTFQSSETFDNLQLGLRMGRPRQIVTTTPRPVRTIRDLVADSDTVVTRGTSYENRANLAPAFYRQVIRRYEGTRRGQQEIMGLLLEDVPGALWQRSMIKYKAAPELERVVVGIDPSVSDSEDAARCGIVAAGKGTDGLYYVLADRSLRASPDRWAHEAISLFHELEAADRIIAEVNQGGKMVELTLRTIDPLIPYSAVHASVGKKARAEPVSALYEQGRVFHVEPFRDLEDQMCLAGGTLVTCIDGDRRIEDIVPGDQVLTSQGWRMVLHAGLSGVKMTLYIDTENGYNIQATADHPIARSISDFVPAGEINAGDSVLCLSPSFDRLLNIEERDISLETTATTRQVAAEGSGFSTVTSGRMQTVPPRKAGMSTISTMIERITPLPTFKPCPEGNMSSIISMESQRLQLLSGSNQPVNHGLAGNRIGLFASNVESGFNPQVSVLPIAPRDATAVPYTDVPMCEARAIDGRMAPSVAMSESRLLHQGNVGRQGLKLGKASSFTMSSAWSAGRTFNQEPSAPSIALRSALAERNTDVPMSSVRVTSVTMGPSIPVYDLTVEGAHEFFANGILVHNCTWTSEDGPSPDNMDAMVWALTELALSRQWRMRPI